MSAFKKQQINFLFVLFYWYDWIQNKGAGFQIWNFCNSTFGTHTIF